MSNTFSSNVNSVSSINSKYSFNVIFSHNSIDLNNNKYMFSFKIKYIDTNSIETKEYVFQNTDVIGNNGLDAYIQLLVSNFNNSIAGCNMTYSISNNLNLDSKKLIININQVGDDIIFSNGELNAYLYISNIVSNVPKYSIASYSDNYIDVLANTAAIDTGSLGSNILYLAQNKSQLDSISNNMQNILDSEANAGIAIASASEASLKASEAEASKNSAQTYMNNAQAYSASAQSHSANSQSFMDESQSHSNNASISASSALSSKNASATSEANALIYKNAAAISATNAATSEANSLSYKNAASTSSSNAATAETNALSYKNSASASATSAANSASTATTKATAASNSESNAATSAVNAATSATNASNSATNASNSATAAANSATNANTSATNALASEANALSYKNSAGTSATNAATSEANALSSKNSAATSATNAATSAANAATKASEAATSATSAATSATNSANSAASSLTSANNSAASATAAANSAASAAAIAGGSISLDSLNNVTAPSPVNGDILSYANATTDWRPISIIPVANGGTGVTTSTGSGSNVLNTSPTLVTPNIGVATGTSFNSITGLSSTTPNMDGVASIGTSTAAARADHVHASDTTKASLSGATFTGAVSGTTFTGISFNSITGLTANTPSAIGDVTTGTAGSATTAARSDHTHGGPILYSGGYTPTVTVSAGGTLSSTSTKFMYTRVGNIVTVSGRITITFTAAGTEASGIISLPIAMSVVGSSDTAHGVISKLQDTASGVINGKGFNSSEVAFSITPSNLIQSTCRFMFTYQTTSI